MLAGFEFVFHETVKVAIPMALLGLWLFFKRDAFCEPLSFDRAKRLEAADDAMEAEERNLEKEKEERALKPPNKLEQEAHKIELSAKNLKNDVDNLINK